MQAILFSCIMAFMTKAVFFDIDGTLLPKGAAALADDTTATLLRLQENGIRIFIATGRPYQALEQLPLCHIPFDGYMTLTGQLCLDKNRKVIHKVSFDEEETAILHDVFCSGMCLMALIDEQGAQYNARLGIEGKPELTVNPEFRRQRAFQLSVFLEKGKEGSFRSQLPEKCTITRWSDAGFDVIPSAGGKAAGMEFFCSLYGFTLDEVMAFGDAENDIDMLRAAGIGVAMGNAGENLKAIADYITSDCDKGGIQKAAAHFGLI